VGIKEEIVMWERTESPRARAKTRAGVRRDEVSRQRNFYKEEDRMSDFLIELDFSGMKNLNPSLWAILYISRI
jgi:hypothetical protein